MPNRIIKESICTSEKISSLSDFEFRVWIGLITQADDMGRGDARAAIVKGRVFPLRDRITVKDIDAAIHGLAAKGCVSLYTVGGRPYFWFPTWGEHQRIRDCKPKFPGPEEADEENDLQQVTASREKSRQVAASREKSRPESNPIQSKSKSEFESKSESKGNARARGEFGWVKLSDEEYNRLAADLGETELKRCIAYIDESAQSSGNKNHWRDWNLVIRRCSRDGWGLKSGKQMQASTSVEPTPERIKQNADWLDDFLEKQEGGNDI